MLKLEFFKLTPTKYLMVISPLEKIKSLDDYYSRAVIGTPKTLIKNIRANSRKRWLVKEILDLCGNQEPWFDLIA